MSGMGVQERIYVDTFRGWTRGGECGIIRGEGGRNLKRRLGMIINGLYDPVPRTDEMPVEAFTKYVKAYKEQPRPTASYLVEGIRKRFYGTHGDIVPRSRLDKIWKVIREKLEVNAGLAEFILDYKGAESEFFFPWLLNVWSSPSLALEMAYGWGTDMRGKFRKAEDDPIVYFVRNDPTFVYNRERQLYVANLATEAMMATPEYKKSRVVDFGAGRLAWVRWHGFKPSPSRQTIVAFDNDPSIHIDEVMMGSKFACTPEKLGIEFVKSNFMTELENPKCMDATLVNLGGVASYFPHEMFKRRIVVPIHRLLRAKGSFFFDLQLMCPYYERSVAVFSWPEMELAKSATEAIDTIESMRKELWREGVKFGAEYKLDTYNEHPTSVMITMTKV